VSRQSVVSLEQPRNPECLAVCVANGTASIHNGVLSESLLLARLLVREEVTELGRLAVCHSVEDSFRVARFNCERWMDHLVRAYN
jgi:hypothetical protein